MKLKLKLTEKIISPLIRVVLIITGVSIFASCSEKEITPNILAEEISETYQKHSALSYDIIYKVKRFSDIEDTSKISVKIDLIRMSEETIFGGYVWMSDDSISRYYDTEHTYLIMHKNKRIFQYEPTTIDPFPFRANFIEAINVYFLKPERLMNGATDDAIKTALTEEFINQKKSWKWTYNFPKQEGYKKNQKNIWIQQDNYSIPKINFLSIDNQNKNQYNQWDLTNISFDQVSVANLQERFAKLKESYTFEEYIPQPEPSYQPLAIGSNIPGLNLATYPDGQKGTLGDFKGKVTLVDFWYMDCIPCIKAMPNLNELHHKYEARGLQILGVNPFDNNEKNLKRFPNFLSHNQIDYPIFFTNREAIEPFKILGFPTFYLIDKKGKIVHTGTGFSQEVANKIDSLIQINL